MTTRTRVPKSAVRKQSVNGKDESPLEFMLRHTMHDIIDHMLKHWDAFSSAAQQVKVTPAQALASVLAKATLEVLETPSQAAGPKK